LAGIFRNNLRANRKVCRAVCAVTESMASTGFRTAAKLTYAWNASRPGLLDVFVLSATTESDEASKSAPGTGHFFVIPLLLKSLDPELVLAGIEVVREKLNYLNERASPGLKKLIEEYPMPFATVNRLLHYSEDLAKKALAIKEAFEKLAEIVSEPPATEMRQAWIGGNHEA